MDYLQIPLRPQCIPCTPTPTSRCSMMGSWSQEYFYRMQATRQTPRIGEKVARWGWKGKRSARKRANGERIESRTTTESIMDGNGRTVEWKGKVFGNCICFDLSAV